MLKPGDLVFLVVGLMDHDSHIFAVCRSKETAKSWLEKNYEAEVEPYGCYSVSIHAHEVVA